MGLLLLGDEGEARPELANLVVNPYYLPWSRFVAAADHVGGASLHPAGHSVALDARGNPKRIRSVADLARRGVSVAARQGKRFRVLPAWALRWPSSFSGREKIWRKSTWP